MPRWRCVVSPMNVTPAPEDAAPSRRRAHTRSRSELCQRAPHRRGPAGWAAQPPTADQYSRRRALRDAPWTRRYRTRGRACRTGLESALTESLPARAADAAPDDHPSAYLCAGPIENFAPGRHSSRPRRHGRRVDRVGRRCALRRDGSPIDPRRVASVPTLDLYAARSSLSVAVSQAVAIEQTAAGRSAADEVATVAVFLLETTPSSVMDHGAGFAHDGSEGRRLSAEETHLAEKPTAPVRPRDRPPRPCPRRRAQPDRRAPGRTDRPYRQRSTGRRPVPLADALPVARVRGSAVRTGSCT
jgi:hypothetical protein